MVGCFVFWAIQKPKESYINSCRRSGILEKGLRNVTGAYGYR